MSDIQQHKPPRFGGSITSWIAIGITLFIALAGWITRMNQDSAARAAAEAAAAEAEKHSMQRHEQQEAVLERLVERDEVLDDRVDYLCQARRRDDRDSGRPAEDGC